jgi:hypothetical protein
LMASSSGSLPCMSYIYYITVVRMPIDIVNALQ